jgi:hypothetical protein
MIDRDQILRLIQNKKDILIGISLIEQLSSSLYIFSDVEEVVETVYECRNYENNYEAIGMYEDSLPISLKLQVVNDCKLLFVAIHEVYDRGGILKKDFKWHKCSQTLKETNEKFSLATIQGKKEISDCPHWVCQSCEYIAFEIKEADLIADTLF